MESEPTKRLILRTRRKIILLGPKRRRLARIIAPKTIIPTAAYAVFDLDIEEWSDLRGGCGLLVHFARPRDLDPELEQEH